VALLIATIAVLSATIKQEKIVPPVNAPAGGKDVKIEQNKKNSIMRRFISYYRVPAIAY
jgi:hypothetical protein